MNIQDLKKTLPVLLKHNIVPFIWGTQGIGKTQSVGQVATNLYGANGFIHLHLATQEVGDLVGLLSIQADGTVKHARPEWFPTEGEGIVFLDELNRAHPDVIQAMFSFITSKTIHTHKLPVGWKIVAAGNFQNEQFNVTDTSDAAWMSRFCHLTLSPTIQEFTSFAESKGHESVAMFISEHSAMLETKPTKSEELFVTPDRRSWIEMIGPLEQETLDETIRYELYCGIIGTTASSAFFAHKKTASKSIKLSAVLKDYEKVRDRVLEASRDADTRFDLLSAPIDELIHKLGENKDFLKEFGTDNLKAFLLDIPLELLSKTVKKLGTINFTHKEQVLNDPEFVSRITVKKVKKQA